MNWITRNNYTIKRKFNQYNVNKNKNRNRKDDNMNKKNNEKDKEQTSLNNNTNQINYNINNDFYQENNKNLYTSMYYQINGNDNLEQQLKKGENIVQNNLNCKYILSELSEF